MKASPAVKHATKAYRNEMDFIQQWLDERTVLDPQGSIPSQCGLWRIRVLVEAGARADARQPSVLEELHMRGFHATKSNGVRLFKGLRLRSQNPRLHVVETAGKP